MSAALNYIQDEAPVYGFRLNVSKCEIFGKAEDDLVTSSAFSHLRQIDRSDLILLGSPIFVDIKLSVGIKVR